MDEFIVKATLLEGEEITLQALGETIEEVVDTLVQIEAIKSIQHIIRKKDKFSWHLKDKEALSKLREIRFQIKDQITIRKALTGTEVI